MKKYLLFHILFLSSVISWAQNPSDNNLEEKLSEMYANDQAVRQDLMELNVQWAGKPEFNAKMDSITTVMLRIDRENQLFVANLLDSVGWPSGLSFEANMAIFMVIQHSAPEYMSKYADMVEQQYTKGVIIPSLYAIFKDRMLMRADKPQLYGSQIFNGYVWPIEDVENVDERRKQMTLPSMEQYLDMMKNGGNSVVWEKDITIEEIKELIKQKRN
ncbi:DUF6624 domain-containing protein [Prevotella sp. 10(H)]|uniref:DUF6624 domain-containing protein n=1 Tax=Prevotella sp. 10(H) TaxID=1158294 RepID=UPI0004A714C0|nr:DUF6624 domain-containing protein [Prevotella sp. 10(H)]